MGIRGSLVTVQFHPRSGLLDLEWRDGNRIKGLASGARLANGTTLSVSAYSNHTLEKVAEGEYAVRHSGAGLPELIQHLWICRDEPCVSIQAELGHEASLLGTRHFDAVMLDGADSIQLKNAPAPRILHVPFDNDMWFRYMSRAVGELKQGDRFASDEVTAIYDDGSRNALVLGSISHDVWKTAIEAWGDGRAITKLDIYGGITSPTGVRTDTHDTVPHGLVRGERVLSPRVLVGSYSDWRDGLEAYGAANAKLHPSLDWPAGAPMGWNSWAAYGGKVNDSRYLGAAAFMKDELVPHGFGRNKLVYVNLDAFWSNLDAVQLADAVRTIKGMQTPDGTRFEPGIYWTPFAYWSDNLDAYVEGTGMKYRYRDILLKAPDGTLLPKVDGGRAIDPSHPASKARIDYYVKKFEELGFQYLKLDFLSHGALEGAHYDPSIQTGVEAYNEGMKQVVDAAAGRMFLSLSIAPLFPAGYGHARRLSCDTKGHISGGDQSTEYMLNSLTYGWWTKALYLVDPDHVVLGEQADLGARSITEGKSRLLSAIISGGMILDSSRLADDDQAREFAKAVYADKNLLAVTNDGRVFRPVNGDTGDRAANVFVAPSSRGFYVAVFNFDEKQAATVRVPMGRIAPAPTDAAWKVVDAASGSELGTAHGELEVDLQPAESKLIEVER